MLDRILLSHVSCTNNCSSTADNPCCPFILKRVVLSSEWKVSLQISSAFRQLQAAPQSACVWTSSRCATAYHAHHSLSLSLSLCPVVMFSRIGWPLTSTPGPLSQRILSCDHLQRYVADCSVQAEIRSLYLPNTSQGRHLCSLLAR
jgi:hypothetical protein